MQLSPAVEKFVVHWGEMGTRWGINRTVAQIHALLYVSPEPVTAEEIARTLSVARSNVSTSLRELQAWGLVRVSHRLGDRRDYFETITDVWEMFQVILDGRRRREVSPTLDILRECVAEGEDPSAMVPQARMRLLELLRFFELTTGWYEQVRRMPRTTLARFARMGDRVARFLDTS